MSNLLKSRTLRVGFRRPPVLLKSAENPGDQLPLYRVHLFRGDKRTILRMFLVVFCGFTWLVSADEKEKKEARGPSGTTFTPSVINHIHQGKGAYCATASVMMGVQFVANLDLSSVDLMHDLAGIYTAASGVGKKGANPYYILSNFDIPNEHFLYNLKDSQSIAEREDLALKKIQENIIPALESERMALLSVTSINGYPHIMLLHSYNSKNKKFLVFDPLNHSSEEWSLSRLAKQWPLSSEGAYSLRAHLLSRKEEHSPRPTALPENAELDVTTSSLVGLKVAPEISFPKTLKEFHQQKFHESIEGAKVAQLSSFWESGRKAEEVKGIATWLKVRVAMGEPACLFYKKSEGEINCVAVSGYRDGFNNFEGDIQISELDDKGKVTKRWLKCSELLRRAASPGEGDGDSFHVIYPGAPITEEWARAEFTGIVRQVEVMEKFGHVKIHFKDEELYLFIRKDWLGAVFGEDQPGDRIKLNEPLTIRGHTTYFNGKPQILLRDKNQLGPLPKAGTPASKTPPTPGSPEAPSGRPVER